jgi:hypothetical protein
VGDWFQVIVDVEVSGDAVEALADDVRSWLIEDSIVVAKRSDCVLSSEYGHAPGLRVGSAVESSGDHFVGLRTNGLEIVTGRTVFDAGQGADGLMCPHCRHLDRFVDADTGAPTPQWARFGSAIDGWWRGADGRFIADLGERLGHRVVYVCGKL